MREWKNWSETYSCHPRQFFQPTSISEIISILKRAEIEKSKVKVVGAGHSPSRITLTNDYMINLDKMNRIISIDSKEKLVKVEAGIRITELNEILSKNGLALSVLGSISEQSVAGAISTGTHGTGLKFGICATYIKEIEFISSTGEVILASKAESPQIFSAILCGLGALGIIVTVTLQCEAAYNLEAISYPISYEKIKKNYKTMARSSEHFRFWIFPHTSKCSVWQANRTKKTTTKKSYFSFVKEKWIGYYLLEFLLYCSLYLSSLVPLINRLYQSILFNRKVTHVDRNDRVFNFDCLFKQYVTEWSIPIDNLPFALDSLLEIIKEKDLKVHFPIEVRFVKGDDIMVSPCFGRDSCYIGIIMYRPYGHPISYEEYFKSYEQMMVKLGGRPHWAKEILSENIFFSHIYPQWDEFKKIREALDPEHRFSNEYLDRIFGNQDKK